MLVDWDIQPDIPEKRPLTTQEIVAKNSNAIIVDSMEQGSQEWLAERCGNITMSNAKKLLSGGQGLTRLSYIKEVAAERITHKTGDNFKSHDMLRGTILEEYARRAYIAETGNTVTEISLGYLDSGKRISASPDGLVIVGESLIKGVEIKCLKPKNHIEFIMEKENPKEFMAQMQGCMWVFGCNEWDYVSYCPEFKEAALVVITVKRDNEMITKIRDSALNAVAEVDAIVSLSNSIKNNNLEEINKDAMEAIDILLNYDDGGIQ